MAASQPRPTGSADPQMMLVPYRPGYGRKRLVSVVMLLLLVAVLAYAGGYWQGLRQNFHLLDQRAALGGKMSELQRDLQQLQAENAVLRHGSEVERLASEQVRQENLQLQNRFAELDRTVNLYKAVLSPEGGEKGLRIQRLDLLPLTESHRVRLRLVLSQLASDSEPVTGSIRYNLLGIQGEKSLTLAFDQIAHSASADGLAFSFRFFQEVSDEFLLPDGFVPQQIEVIVQAKGRKAAKLERRFDWNVREVSSDVGKGKE